MRGQVLGVDRRSGEGQVAGDDGRRYVFGPADWADRGDPRIGATVDFETRDNRALSLFPVPGQALPANANAAASTRRPRDRSKYVAALLALFLGWFGVHRFYLGRTASAATMLILSLSGVGLVASMPWALIDTLRYLFMSDRDFAARYA